MRLLTRYRSNAAGFTFIELTISISILGILMSAITSAMLVAFKSTAVANEQLGENGDLQFASIYFPNDVRSSNQLTALGSARCGTGTLVLEFSGPDFDTSLKPVTRVVSYVTTLKKTPDGVSVLQLWRLACATDSSAPKYPLAPVDQILVANQLSESRPPTAACADSAGQPVACSLAPADTASLTLIEDSGTSYVLTGNRRTS